MIPCAKKRKTKTKVHASDEVVDFAKSQSVSLHFRPEKFKIMLTYIQILSLFRSNYAIQWPGLVRQMFRILSSFNLDIVQLVALDCIYRSNYFFSLTVVCLVPIIVALILSTIKRAGFSIYSAKLKQIPRYCVKLGKPVRGWIDEKTYHDIRIKATKAALESAGVKTVTKQMLRDELKESRPLLPAAASITKGLDGKETTLNTEQLQNIVLKNIKNFKKRALIRINHIFYNNKCFKMLFWLLLLSYPSVSLRVTRYFVCEQIGETYILSFDLYTPCYDLEYSTYGVIAFLGLILYVIGIPVLFITILWRARNNGVAWKLRMCQINKDVESRMLKEAKIDAKLSREHWMDPLTDKDRRKACRQYQQRINFRSHRVYNRLGFIYYAYNEESWWYEVIELSRKLALNGLVALITPGEASQIVAGIMICAFYLIFVMVMKPYKSRSDHMLSASTHASLMATLLCGLSINLELHFLGHRTFPTIEERYKYEMLCIELLVVGQAGLVFIQFIVGVIIENTCSPEMKHLKRLQQQREQARKRASTRSKRRYGLFQDSFHLWKTE